SPTTFRRESAARWPIFVFAGIVCFGLSRLLGFRKRKAASAVIVVSLLFSSCSFFNGKLLVMEGNYYNSVQKYDDAIASYLKAAEIGGSSPYAEYGLGYSYHALDENEAALQQYAAAEKNLDNASGDHQELRYRLNFNTGIIYFEQGDFGGASDSFRKALEIDGSRLDAKKNLELSLLAQSRQNKNEGNAAALADAAGERQTQNSGSGAGESDDQRVRALYDYLRQKEQEQWRNEWTGDSNPVWPDY
ncbi:MAG: tetratricopeptide repeat protein, partial [Treponema sp.]|nr:tetratricopeptide repeat protein [Treponema sp.]